MYYITSNRNCKDIYSVYESNGLVVTRITKVESQRWLKIQIKLITAAKKFEYGDGNVDST